MSQPYRVEQRTVRSTRGDYQAHDVCGPNGTVRAGLSLGDADKYAAALNAAYAAGLEAAAARCRRDANEIQLIIGGERGDLVAAALRDSARFIAALSNEAAERSTP